MKFVKGLQRSEFCYGKILKDSWAPVPRFVSTWWYLRSTGGEVRSNLTRSSCSANEFELRNKAACTLGHRQVGSLKFGPGTSASQFYHINVTHAFVLLFKSCYTWLQKQGKHGV